MAARHATSDHFPFADLRVPAAAAAAFMSFMPVLPWIRYGATNWAGVMRAPRPRSRSLWLQSLGSRVMTARADYHRRLAIR